MVSEYEASKLRRDMKEELEGSTALLKCAVGLLVIVLLAVVSPTLGTHDNAAADGAATTAATADL